MLDAKEAIKKFLDFESRASAKRSTQINRIKEDRTFLSGKQWGTEDDSLIPATRCRRTVNVLGNACNSVVNQYGNYPYKWYSGDEEVDEICDIFLKSETNARAPLDGLTNTVAFGLGYMAIGSDTVIAPDGESMEIPSLYSIDRVENVYWDPDSIEIDGSDAIEAAIVEMRSKNYIRAKYGDEWVTSHGTKSLVNVSDNLDSEQEPIVTYFRIEDGKCSVYRLLNNDFLEKPVQLPIERIPIFPIFGEKTWEGDNIIWQGLVRKGAPIQKLVNYAFTSLSERMAFAPKQIFTAIPEAVEGFQDEWRTYNKSLNPILLWNQKSADGKREFPEPKIIQNQIQFTDISGIISSNLEMLSTILGVDSKGLVEGGPELTATQVLYNERQVNNNTRHFYVNLRDSFRAAGVTILKLLGYDNVNLDVIQGPAEYMEKQVARQELVQLAAIVPDQDKLKIVDGILLSHNDNAILRNVYGALHAVPAPTPMEQQAIDTVEQMKQAIDQKDQQITDLQEQLKQYESVINSNDKSLKADFLKEEMKHRFTQEDMILKAQLDQGADTQKAQVEVDKAKLDLQKSAIQLDAAEVKAKTDMIKSAASIAGALTNENSYTE